MPATWLLLFNKVASKTYNELCAVQVPVEPSITPICKWLPIGAELLSKDEARKIAVNIAKLPHLSRK